MRVLDPVLELVIEVIQRREHEAMEGEFLRQRLAPRDPPVLNTLGQVEMDVEATPSRAKAAKDPAGSVQNDQLWRHLYACVVELLDGRDDPLTQRCKLGRSSLQELRQVSHRVRLVGAQVPSHSLGPAFRNVPRAESSANYGCRR